MGIDVANMATANKRGSAQAARLKTILRFTNFHTELLVCLLHAVNERHLIHISFRVILGHYSEKCICKCVKQSANVRLRSVSGWCHL